MPEIAPVTHQPIPAFQCLAQVSPAYRKPNLGRLLRYFTLGTYIIWRPRPASSTTLVPFGIRTVLCTIIHEALAPRGSARISLH